MENGEEKLVIAFFDFDGTVIKKDSFLCFICFVKGRLKSWFGFILLSPFIVLYKLKLLHNDKAKEIVFTFFFKGSGVESIKQKGKAFTKVIDKMLRPAAVDKINWHKRNKHKVYIVTASSEIWLGEWCRQNDLAIIATDFITANGKLTGKIRGKNCYGPEKVSRIKAVCDLTVDTDIYAYGNSKGDLPMLEIANNRFYKRF